MDKDYLIHNILIEDDENGHDTLDLKFDNITVGDDVNSASNNDVSLTGAGGGGVPYQTAKMNLTILTDEGDPFTTPIKLVGLECVINSISSFSNCFCNLDKSYDIPVTENHVEIDINLFDETNINGITLIDTNDAMWVWDRELTTTVTGNATFTGQQIEISGDFAVTAMFFLD